MLSNYPKAKEIIEQTKMTHKVDQIKWLQMNKEEAAINMAKLIIIQRALRSNSIPLRTIATEKVDTLYHQIGNRLHVFAKEEGRSQAGFTNEDVTRLFAHIEIGGNRYGFNRKKK